MTPDHRWLLDDIDATLRCNPGISLQEYGRDLRNRMARQRHGQEVDSAMLRALRAFKPRMESVDA